MAMADSEGLRLLAEIYAVRDRTGTLMDGVLAHAADDIEWWAAGPPGVLPWAGSFRGREGVARWFQVLNGSLEYDRWDPVETFAAADHVVEIVRAGGRVRSNGRRYESDIVRVWTFRGGKLVRVRSFYDTAAYNLRHRRVRGRDAGPLSHRAPGFRAWTRRE